MKEQIVLTREEFDKLSSYKKKLADYEANMGRVIYVIDGGAIKSERVFGNLKDLLDDLGKKSEAQARTANSLRVTNTHLYLEIRKLQDERDEAKKMTEQIRQQLPHHWLAKWITKLTNKTP